MSISSAASFGIATYNIHSCVGTDRRFSPARIARIIRNFGAEVIALQEVGWYLRGRRDFDQFEYLRERTGFQVIEGITRNHRRAHFGNAILTRSPVRRVELLDLSVPFRAPRGAIDADIEIDGVLVRVINAHLGLDPKERQEQFNTLCEVVQDNGDRPMLLLGDFNEWRVNNTPLEQVAVHFPKAQTPRTFHTRKPLLRLDRIYASDGLALSEACVVQTGLARRASDHLPVTCEVSLSIN